VKLILGCLVFAKIRELVTEVIEVFNKLLELLLLRVRSMNEL
jgi:superfamily II DNA/RNA helicase